jgi:hypothetical protein
MNRIGTLSILAFLLPVLLLSQKRAVYPRTMYVSYDRAPVYAEADYTSEIIGTLRLRDSVAVLASQGKYFQISLGGRRGYVLWSNMSAAAVKVKGGKGAKSGTVKGGGDTASTRIGEGTKEKEKGALPDTARTRLQPEVRRETKRASSESQLPQCRAITKSGKQCSRRAADSSGYCWQHREKH